MRRLLVIVGALTVLVVAQCQGAFAARLERQVEVGGTIAGTTENSDDDIDSETDRKLGWAKVKHVMPLGGGKALILGLSWEGQFVNYDKFRTTSFQGSVVTEDDLPESLHSVDATVGLSWRMGENWTAMLQFVPGIHSDFEDVSSEDVIYTGSALFVRPFGNGNRIGLGISYSDAFGDPSPFPMVLIDWYPAEHWYVEGTLPTSLDAGYRFDEALSLGLEGKLKGYLYRLSEDAPWNDAVLRYREVQVGPYVDYRLFGKMHVRASAGMSVANKFEIHDDENDEKLADGDYDNAGYATATLYYTF